MTGIFEDARLIGADVVLGIGVFDGVHRGHQRVLAELAAMAAARGAKPVAMTFDPHPRAVLRHEAPPMLMPLGERLQMLKKYGAAEAVVVRFTPEFAQLPPEEFLNRLLDIPARLHGICVGSQWRFGAGGAGDTGTLARYCEENGLAFRAVPELELDGETVSSSLIRRAIAAGRLDEAAERLGRRYRLCGIVEAGFHIAGGELKCPTANLRMEAGILPPDGVYAGRAETPEGAFYPAAVNIGVSPTFGWADQKRRVEVHLIGFNGDLYGSELKVELLDYLRSERTFPDSAALKEQIGADIEKIRRLAEK